jgi:peptide subunit release factor 1 (eRF1)
MVCGQRRKRFDRIIEVKIDQFDLMQLLRAAQRIMVRVTEQITNNMACSSTGRCIRQVMTVCPVC